MKKIFYIFVLSIIAFSCSDENSKVISSGKMEDIIYDIHLAQGVIDVEGPEHRAMNDMKYRLAVLKKYDVTQEEWDSSFNYYCRHADKLHEIYNNVAERMRDEIVNLGGEVALNDEGFSADTANIWKGERNFVLTTYEPYNIKTFSIDADSTIKKGDKLTMQFDTQFIFQDGMRDVIAVMAVTFMNDSVTSQVRHVTQQMSMTMSIQDDGHLGIKKVSGYFLLSKSLNDVPSTTLRLGCVSNVRIVCAHEEKKEEEKTDENARQDSLNNARRDSLGTQNGGGTDSPSPQEPPVGGAAAEEVKTMPVRTIHK